MFGLQRLCYGPLRPIEVEQLYEKAWFAITETCLAMTIFREEVGGWFLVMFVCLLVGKVWGWIGEGRVEILEQQPPSNPRLFHARLSVSLIISTLFNVFMLRYSIVTVLRHARPNMMVMFAFEFAVLTVTSLSTAARYTISLHEASIIATQIRHHREKMRQQQLTTEPTLDLEDFDPPGWQDKGKWTFYLDLTTGRYRQGPSIQPSADCCCSDFIKLILYLTFFCVLCMFYGMPIHIIRDVALTIRSFYKRIADFVRYRQATKDMNARYPDATPEEVAREDVCIICREDMRPWRPQNAPNGLERDGARGDDNIAAVDERLRPKKLPCGHILHFACLRSWLERQQICPTCRRPVLAVSTAVRAQEHGQVNQNVRDHGRPNNPQVQGIPQENAQQPIAAQNVFNLGPLRIAFGARRGVPQQINTNPPPPIHQGQVPGAGQNPRITSTIGLQRQAPALQNRTAINLHPTNLQLQLIQIEQQLNREIHGLRLQQNQLHLVRTLQGEIARLRMIQANPESQVGGPPSMATQFRLPESMPQAAQAGQNFVSTPQLQSMSYSHPNLPPGMTIPPGWTVLPLQRLPDEPSANSGEGSGTANHGVQPRTQTSSPSSGLPESNSNAPAASSNPKNSRGPPFMSRGNGGTSHPGANGVAIPSLTETGSSPAEGQPEQRHREDTMVNDEVQSLAPRWGPNVQSQECNQEKLDEFGSSRVRASTTNGNTSEDEGQNPHTSINSTQLKGKGKASTVEDFIEDTD